MCVYINVYTNTQAGVEMVVKTDSMVLVKVYAALSNALFDSPPWLLFRYTDARAHKPTGRDDHKR